jgi:hypothetical protein
MNTAEKFVLYFTFGVVIAHVFLVPFWENK